VGKITRIFVSENGGDRASQAVCEKFPHLPITYIFRDPQLPSLGHAQAMTKECLEGDFACILHDDDWWLPHHVEEALAAFEAHPDASVYGANMLLQEGETLTDRECFLFAWFGASYPPPTPVWRLTSSNLLLASLFGLVAHYSSLVARTSALAQAAYVYGLDNPFDNDRMILFALSQFGPAIYNQKLGVGVRVHEQRETTRMALDERERRMCQTTDWMIGLSNKSWSVVAALFAQRLGRCPDVEKKIYFIREAAIRPWCLPEIARHLDPAKETAFFAMYNHARLKFAGIQPQSDR